MRCLTYHRVITGPPRSAFDVLNAIQATELAVQADELRRHWRVLSLEELADGLDRGRFSERAVHVTFDDGFADNLIAAEILAEHGLPWSLFVVADAVLAGFRPWYMRLADALACADRVVEFSGRSFDCRLLTGQLAFKGVVKDLVMAAPVDSHLAVLDNVLAAVGLVLPADSTAPYLDAAGLRRLQAAGVTIGNHSARHPNLVRCHDDELEQEVLGSRRALEAVLGVEVRAFSYPDGRHDARVRDAVRHNYDLAFATWSTARPHDRYAIPRVDAGADLRSLRDALVSSFGTRRRLRRVARRAARRFVPRSADRQVPG